MTSNRTLRAPPRLKSSPSEDGCSFKDTSATEEEDHAVPAFFAIHSIVRKPLEAPASVPLAERLQGFRAAALGLFVSRRPLTTKASS